MRRTDALLGTLSILLLAAVVTFIGFNPTLLPQAILGYLGMPRRYHVYPSATSNWVDTKLYFGLAPEGDASRASSEAQWQDFLDHEVTPRFPAGLSVMDVNGQWQGIHNPAPVHVATKLLIIDYPDTPDNFAKIEAIRTAWKQRTHDQSVLKVTQPADVSF